MVKHMVFYVCRVLHCIIQNYIFGIYILMHFNVSFVNKVVLDFVDIKSSPELSLI